MFISIQTEDGNISELTEDSGIRTASRVTAETETGERNDLVCE